MTRPCVVDPPDAVLVAVEDADLAIGGACGASVAVAVVCDGLHDFDMAVFDVDFDMGPLLHDGRFSQRWKHGDVIGEDEGVALCKQMFGG